MILDILKYPHPVLRKKSKAVKKVEDEVRRLTADMIETMLAAPGVGLAAPQVGHNLRIITVNVGEGAFAMVNPKVTQKNKILQTFDEGCLCLPGLVGPVSRPSRITVEGLDQHGQKLILEAEGFLATVLQHEIDHLDGIVFTDRVKDKSNIREVSRKEEEEKKELL